MKIFVKNIGLINEVNIETEGITVIGGYNSSGKNTVLKAVYSLLYSNFDLKSKIVNERKRSLFKILEYNDIIDDLNYSYLDIKKLSELLFERFCLNNELSMEEFSDILKNKVRQKELSAIIVNKDDMFSYIDETYEDRLLKLYKKVKTVFQRDASDYERFIFSKYFQNVFIEKINMYNNKENCKVEIEIDKDISFAEFKENKLSSYKKFSNCNISAWYLSTSHFTENRGSIIYLKLNEAIKKEHDIDIIYETYSDIEENKETLNNILQEIIHGSISVSDGSLIYKDDKTNLSYSMDNVASGMKNLLVIKKLLDNGSLVRNSILLIDEPETNMHPEWQVKFAEILVLLYKELNIKVLANSHSPYFMRAVEVKLADYGIKGKGHFYIMRENVSGTFCTEDVTNDTNEIYKMLYKPLDYL